MSNSLAIAAVTSAIRYVLDRALERTHPGQVGDAAVTTLHPAKLVTTDLAGSAGINVYCYQGTPNHAWNLTDLPTRRGDGSTVKRPIAALDLHYLLTCYGEETRLEPQRLLGRVVGALAATSMLTRGVVTAALDLYSGDDTETPFLAASDLAEEVELVKLSPATLSLEEMSNLWGMLDTPYQLSLTYLATVVLIAADVTPKVALPVRRRALTVSPSGPPRLASVTTDPADQAAGTGSTVVVRGSRLLGPGAGVRIGPVALAPQPGATADEVRVVVADTVPAGVHAVQVTHRSPAGPTGAPSRVVATSNAVPLVVRPSVNVTGIDADAVTLAVSPPLQAGQRATVVLGRLPGDSPEDPTDVTLVLPPLPEEEAPQPSLVVPSDDIPEGRWLVRLQVDGVDSLPDLVGETYAAPSITLPAP
jgi:hypothetical protein